MDYTRRNKIMPNHTFTHVLNFALRKVQRIGRGRCYPGAFLGAEAGLMLVMGCLPPVSMPEPWKSYMARRVSARTWRPAPAWPCAT